MKILSISLILLICIGCSPNKKGPAKNWTGTIKLLPIVIKNTKGETKWTEKTIEEQLAYTNDKWTKTDISFKAEKPIFKTDDDLFAQKGLSGFLNSLVEADKIVKATNQYPVFFVDSIVWNGQNASGMSTAPFAPYKFKYGTNLSSSKDGGRALAHELGHAWNLLHVWSDPLKDTPSTGPENCTDNNRCNVMSYCWPKNCSEDDYFSPEQIKAVRKGALLSSRRHLMIFSTTVPESQVVEPFSNHLKPSVDLDKSWEKRP